MSSAANHARRSRRGYRMQKSITGGMEANIQIKTVEKKRHREAVNVFRRLWMRMTGKTLG